MLEYVLPLKLWKRVILNPTEHANIQFMHVDSIYINDFFIKINPNFKKESDFFSKINPNKKNNYLTKALKSLFLYKYFIN